MLHANNNRMMVVPENCTHNLQPIDQTINNGKLRPTAYFCDGRH